MRQPNLSNNIHYLDKQTFTGDALGASKTIRGNVRQSNLLIVSVKYGAIDVWIGEYTGNQPGCPDFHFGQTNRPVWVPLPASVTTITLVAAGQETTTGAVHLAAWTSVFD